MKTKHLTLTANFPSISEFAERFPQYGPFSKGKGSLLFKLIMTTDNFNRMQVLTEFNLPAVSGVAEICYQEIIKSRSLVFSGYIKQYIGATVCCLMEYNNYRKTGKKRAIPHAKFTKGEVYESNKKIKAL